MNTPTEQSKVEKAAPLLLEAAWKALSVLSMANVPDGTQATAKEAFEATLAAIKAAME